MFCVGINGDLGRVAQMFPLRLLLVDDGWDRIPGAWDVASLRTRLAADAAGGGTKAGLPEPRSPPRVANGHSSI